MAKPSFEAAKGTKDWFGKDTILRNRIRDTLRNVFERYGYDRLETPEIERRESLGFKGGGEIQKEVFRLHDQGGRDLALRFDQTVPLARFIASNRDIKFPFKRYAIGPVFRDGPTQPDQGRYRIFNQCDVDVLGIRDMAVEAELFALAQDSLRELGLGEVEVNINNRKLLDGILDHAEVPDIARLRTIVTLDKMDKIGEQGVREELNELYLFDEPKAIKNETLSELFEKYDSLGPDAIVEPGIQRKVVSEVGTRGLDELYIILKEDKGRSELYQDVATYSTHGNVLLDEGMVNKIMDVVSIDGSNEEIFGRLEKVIESEKGREGLGEIRKLLDYSKALGFDFIRFNPVLARGLDYYTGTTIEVYLKNRDLCPSAILAGGRFDDMVGEFRGGNEEIPAVGFSFGLERLAMILGEQKDTPKTYRQLYVIPIGDTADQCLKVCHDLRNQGIRVDMKLQPGGKVGKAVTYADKTGIPYVGFIGQSEIENRTIRLKNLRTGNQVDSKISDVEQYIK